MSTRVDTGVYPGRHASEPDLRTPRAGVAPVSLSKGAPTATLTTPQALAADAKKQLATNKRRGQSLLAIIERRKDRITEAFYDIGEALRGVLKNELYAALGFDTFEHPLDERQVMSRAQAAKLIRLVDSIPRDEALRLGQEKFYALVTKTFSGEV